MRFPTMATVVVVALFALTACGGTGAAPTAVPATASPGDVPTAAAPTASPTSAPTATAGSLPTDVPVTPPPGEPTPTAADTEVDLCSLLTVNDVNAVLEGNFLEGELTSTGGYCHWDSAMSSGESVITAIDDRSLDAIKTAGPGGVDMTAGGRAAYSVRNEDFLLQTTFIDLYGQSLIVEFPTSSSADDDLADAQELADIAVGNL